MSILTITTHIDVHTCPPRLEDLSGGVVGWAWFVSEVACVWWQAAGSDGDGDGSGAGARNGGDR